MSTAATKPLERMELDIEGMSCANCSARLEKALNQSDGLSEAVVNITTERAVLTFDPAKADAGTVAKLVSDTGFDVGKGEIAFDVEGMTCANCAGRVEKAMRAVPGVFEANVNLALERANATVVAGNVSAETLTDAVEAAGYHAVLPQADDKTAEADHQRRADKQLEHERRILRISALLTAPLVIQMIFVFAGFEDFHLMPAAEVLLATPIQFVIGARFYKAALTALKNRSANMDVLVAMGTSAAYFYSWYLLQTLGEEADGELYFEASAVIITLVLLGKYLEAKAKRRTTDAIRSLMDLRPQTAIVKGEGGTEVEVPVGEVKSGFIVVIRPGERVPVDGEIVEGESEIDESLITGESLPVHRGVGGAVTGGAINLSGFLQVRATQIGEDSTLSKIIRLVENAQAGKASVQRLVDRISEIFVPSVITIAVITFAAWMIASGSFESALIAGVSVLVIACPCALGLATPTAIMTGTGAAARAGILFKDVASLERAHLLDAVIFDKTGTLTEGRPKLVEAHALRGDAGETLRLVAAVQQGSEHPLARAIREEATERGLALPKVTNFQNMVGRGVRGQVEGRDIAIGNLALLAEQGVVPEAGADLARQWESEGKTVVWSVDAEGPLGLFAIADPVRPESRQAVASLAKIGVHSLMLSGDAQAVASEIGQQVGIEDARGGVRPDEKAQVVAELTGEGRSVGMIGDGINDAPALAAAEVGFAMGTGTDIAMETAGVTLMRADPRLVEAAIAASRATFRKIKQNLFWAFIYNVIGIPLAAAGYLSPTLAGAAMAMSSVSVVSNSLWLRGWRPRFESAKSEGA